MPTSGINITADVFLAAAKQHGEDSEPDHEAGDLQQFFRSAYRLLTPLQKVQFARTHEVALTVAAAQATIGPKFDEETFINAAEKFGKTSPSELNALITFFNAAFDQLKNAQRRALIDDTWVQETLQNAAGICDIEPNDGPTIYSAIAEHVMPRGFVRS